MEENSLLVTCDVVSLYTSIPHSLDMESITFWLNESPDSLPGRFDHAFILKSIDFILRNNYFSFEDNWYLQISGTAMGTKMAPTYASLVMGYLELKMYTQIKDIYPSNVHSSICQTWLRYIDDCWFIWNNKFGDLTIFFSLINNLHSSIRFTTEHSTSFMHFLDVGVHVGNDKSLNTDIYHKPTDSFNYVPFNSNHPKHILKNIPYVLARRIKHIVSDKTTRDRRWSALKSRLSHLKYPQNLIENAIQRAKDDQISQIVRPTAIENDASSNTNKPTIIPFIHLYNPNNPAIFNSILSPIAQSLNTLEFFKNCRFRRTFRQPRSLISLLSKNNRFTFNGIQKCEEKLCKCCAHMIVGTQISFTCNSRANDRPFYLRHNFNCFSRNLIYKLVCNNCQAFYIGQTGDTLRHRMTVHRQQINNINYSLLRVSKHIARCAANKNPKFLVAPFYQLSPNVTRLERERKELHFIKLFKPPLNDSLT